jgi:hypothetical protein
VACGVVVPSSNAHTIEQPPQWSISFDRFASQSGTETSQSAVGAGHVVAEHTPPAQLTLAHGTPQPPQLSSVSSGSSQPVLPLMSQSPKLPRQFATSQLPPAQVGTACARLPHDLPHAPQSSSVLVCFSQF